MRLVEFIPRWALAVVLVAVSVPAFADPPHRLLIIGQDLGSVRGYIDSGCCPAADGNTAYLYFYDLLSPQAGYGGLGMDPNGEPLDAEYDWGGGPVSAWKSATEFGTEALAIGLSITENDHPGALDRLAAGEYDANIRQLARFLNSVDVSVYLRIGYEFDGFWNHGYQDAERYKTVWRRIVDGLRAEQVSNTRFVWQAAVFPMDRMHDGKPDRLSDWYPGDDYVDWMGFSSFVGLDERPAIEVDEAPPTARELIDELLTLAREHGKPVMIAEAAPQGFDLAAGTVADIAPGWDGPQAGDRLSVSPDEIWDQWYGPLFDYMNENGDVIRALAYINCNWDEQDLWDEPYESGYWGDSRLEASPELARRFTRAVEQWKSGH